MGVDVVSSWAYICDKVGLDIEIVELKHLGFDVDSFKLDVENTTWDEYLL